MKLAHRVFQLQHLYGVLDRAPMDELAVIAARTALIRLACRFKDGIVPMPPDQVLGRPVGRDIVNS